MLASIGTISSSYYTDAAQALISNGAITDGTQQSAIRTLVSDLKSNDLWDKHYAIWPFVGGTALAHKFNLKNAQDKDSSYRLVFNGTWSHSANGADPDGSTAYANTFFIPSTRTNQNDFNLSAYSREATPNARDCLVGGEQVSGNAARILKFDSDYFVEVNNNFSGASFTYANHDGFFTGSRLDPVNYEVYRNAVSIASKSIASTLVTQELYIGAHNANGTAAFFSNRELAWVSVGTGLTSSEISTLYTIVQAFQTTLGRNV